MSENGEAQNETPSESDKMDISEVSDQVSPVSDQSQSDAVDNQRPPVGPMRLTPLDNASAPLDTAMTTTTTSSTTTTGGTTRGRLGSTLSLEGLDLELPSLDMYQEEYADFPSSPKHLKERLEAHGLAMPLERDSGTTGGSEEEEEDDTSIYQAVLSPDCQDVRLRKDSSAEDTVLPMIQDAKENGETNTDVGEHGRLEDMKAKYRRVLPNPEDLLLPQIDGVTREITVLADSSFEIPKPGTVKGAANNVKTAMSDDMFLRPGKLAGRKPKSLAGDKLNDKNRRNSQVDPTADDYQDIEEEESSFVFERRDSKRLTRKELGERIMEGLFVESRRKDQAAILGLRKIAVPEGLTTLNSPPQEHPPKACQEKRDDCEVEDNPRLVSTNGYPVTCPNESISQCESSDLNPEYRLSCTNVCMVTTAGNTTEKSETTGTDVKALGNLYRISNGSENDSVTETSSKTPQATNRKLLPQPRSAAPSPIPAVRTRSLVLSDEGTRPSRNDPPRPKPRRKHEELSEPEAPRGPVLLLDPATLESRNPRGVPKINPDGSVEVQPERPGSLVAPQRGGRRKIQVSADILNGPAEEDNVSSGDSRLSDTDMMSPDDDPDLDALLSPDLDTPDELEDSIMERLGEPPPVPDPIPELSAAEERAEARSWRNCIVAGLERRIDMKVIEPYKRVLSHGGYLAAGSHNAIIVFSACFLPDRSRVDYDYVMDNLFLYVLTTLDQLITEDYVLIYLHGATSRSCMPTFSWLKRCYQMIDRRLRKNLKGLYLVHPTFWLKTIVLMTRPFISSKFSRKLSFVESLNDLATIVPLEQASIPDRVKQLDFEQQARLLRRRRLLPWWPAPVQPTEQVNVTFA